MTVQFVWLKYFSRLIQFYNIITSNDDCVIIYVLVFYIKEFIFIIIADFCYFLWFLVHKIWYLILPRDSEISVSIFLTINNGISYNLCNKYLTISTVLEICFHFLTSTLKKNLLTVCSSCHWHTIFWVKIKWINKDREPPKNRQLKCRTLTMTRNISDQSGTQLTSVEGKISRHWEITLQVWELNKIAYLIRM